MEIHTTAESLVSYTQERRLVSYFDHEFIPFSESKINHDVEEIDAADFSQVVLTVSESDMNSSKRYRQLQETVDRFTAKGIEVWADPWHLGGVHGGEAISSFELSGEKGCFCNHKLDTLVNEWIQTVGRLGISKVFWDEPEMKCDEHRGDELRYIQRYTSIASDAGLTSAVCLTADHSKVWQLEEVATYDTVEEIATDPYYPNAFTIIPESNRLKYVAEWATLTRQIADNNGKLSHVWVQAFNIPNGAEIMVQEHITVCRQAMADIAVWGFKACESVPDFIKANQASADVVWRTALHTLRS